MNYLMAFLFMALVSSVAGEVRRILSTSNSLDHEKYSKSLFFGISILIVIIVSEFVLLSNGFARIMEM